MFFIRIFLIFLVLVISAVHAEEDNTDYFYIKPSAFTGSIFMTMTEDDKALYLLGLGDGINLAPFFKSDEETYAKYRSCFEGMTGADLASKVSDYLNTHKDQLAESIHISVFKAYTEFCYANNSSRN